MKAPELSVVMPFYNEGKQTEITAKNALANLKKLKIDFELILVDNGYKDETGEIIKGLGKTYKNIVPVRVEKNIGYGFGVRMGLAKADGNVLGWTDGDGQFDIQSLNEAYTKLKSGNYGLCKGKRTNRGDSLLRKFASICFNLLFNILFLNTTTDINSKPKFITRKCYKSFSISSNDWFIDAEVLIKAKRMGFRICDIPLTFSARKTGKSNVKFMTVLEFLFNLIKFRL